MKKWSLKIIKHASCSSGESWSARGASSEDSIAFPKSTPLNVNKKKHKPSSVNKT